MLICCCPFLFPFLQILPSKSFLSDAHISKGCQNKHTSCFHISTLCDWSTQRANKRQIISWCRGHLFPFAQHWFCSSMMTSLLNSSKVKHNPRCCFFFTRTEVHFVLQRNCWVSILACLWINTWHKEEWVRWAVNNEVKIFQLAMSRTQVFCKKAGNYCSIK